MKLETAWGRNGSDYGDVTRAMADLETALGGPPDIVFFHGSERCNPRSVVELATARWPNARLHGGSSGMGIMARGQFQPDPTSFGLLGIVDPRGAYGVGSVVLGEDPRQEVKEALRLALEQAGRPGEVPSFVLLTAPPGREEDLLLGIADVVGAHVPVTGGSSGDEAVTGNWWQAANRTVGSALAVVTVLFPSGAVVSSFQAGYEVMNLSGKITRASGRQLHEIDGRPAADVYNEWTGGAIAEIVQGGGKIPQKTSALHPLGRRAGTSGGVVEYVMSFLDTVLPDGTLTLFTEAREGETVWAMRGTDDSLLGRAGRVARASLDALSQEGSRERVVGALVVFCCASAVYVRDRMPEVVASLDVTLGDRPYLGTFTFGEQGRFLAGGNRHGNMMISVVLFVGEAPYMFDRSDTVERLHEAVISLERSRRRERELRAVQAGTADVVRVLALADHRHATLDSLLEALRRVLPLQEAAVLVRAGDGTFAPAAQTCDWLSALRLQPGRMLERVLRGEIVVAFDASLIPEWQAQEPEVRARSRSVIHVPLRAGEAAVVLVCTHSEAARFEQRHIDLVRGILPLAGRILEKVDLRDIPTARDRERRSRLAVLTAIVEHLQAGVLVEDDRRRVAAANDQLGSIFRGAVAAPSALVGTCAGALNARFASLTASPEAFVARTSQLVGERVAVAGEEIWLANGLVVERDYAPVATPDAGFIAHLWQYRVAR